MPSESEVKDEFKVNFWAQRPVVINLIVMALIWLAVAVNYFTIKFMINTF